MGDEFEYEKSIESSTLVASNYKTILHLPTIKKQIETYSRNHEIQRGISASLG